MKRLLFVPVLALFIGSAYGEEMDGKACLQKGKLELDSGKYENAAASLSMAEKKFPLLGDYALFWMAEAHHENGNHRESLAAIRSLLRKYPDSPLTKRSRSAEVREAAEISEDGVYDSFEAHLRDYPKDAEMKYLFAKWLKKEERKEKAESIFKEIYISAGPFADLAGAELSPGDICTEDMLRRASNLNGRYEYRDAESLLRTALLKDEGQSKHEILKGLGFSLFRQKKYLEASEMYKLAGERYWEIRSLYRAGEKDKVCSSMDELLAAEDSRFASLLLSIAADKRREGRTEEALTLYRNVAEGFPQGREDALWGIGWTNYLAGKYAEAAETFSGLHEEHGDYKYLYWKARSLEAAGESEAAVKVYRRVNEVGRGFYGLLSSARSNGTHHSKEGRVSKFRKPVKGKPPVSKSFDRFDVLLEFGLHREAASEMIHAANRAGSPEDIAALCGKFEEMGEYKHSVRLAAKVPSLEQVQSCLYPLAYWDTVESLSEKYGINPFLILSVIREESRFDADARSPAGAIGLMQLMPQTALRLDRSLKLGIRNTRDILQVKNNLHLGVSYLSRLIGQFGSYAHAVAAYNAGEEAVRRWVATGRFRAVDEFIEDIPYTETRNYVKRVLASFFEYNRLFSVDESGFENSPEKL
ncbi:MAG: transglycosylase SLT domain-containing protein [Nitrospirota bacterium]